MKIIQTYFLRGPNLYSNSPCIKAVVDLESLDDVSSAELPGFVDALCKLLPTLAEHRCSPGYPGGFIERLQEGTYMAHIVEHVALELQSLAGTDVGFGRARKISGMPRCYAVICAYEIEPLAAQALADAVSLVATLAGGDAFPLAQRMVALNAIAARHRLGPSTQAIVSAARARGIPCRRIAPDTSLFQLGTGSRQQRIQATITGKSSYVAVEIASDKELTKSLLQEAGVPVPRGFTVKSREEAQNAAARLRAPLVIKPLDGNQGKGVTTRVSAAEIASAFERAHHYSDSVVIEEHVEGDDYRVLVVKDRVVAAARRAPPSVLGDGVSTIRALVDRENARPERGEGHESALTKIALDDASMRQLQLQRYTPETVLPAGATAVLRGNANLSTGGTAQDVTDAVHPDVAAACVRAANAVGLDVAGVDLVCTSVAEPLGDKAGAVVEVNAAPGIRMHERPSLGRRRDVGGAIVDALFDGVPACIPIIAVTGTNGKTTTVRLIEHAIRLQGYRTGMANSEGVYRHGRLVSAGDCSGYWSAQSVLAAPDIDAAVLEVARGGILKRGLGFKACDVAVVLNVDRDHLGQDGITDIEGIARVKAVVADSATRTVVLNADDPHCIAMAQDLPRKIEVIYFSMSYNNGVIVNHLENGGRALCLAGDSIVQRSASHDDFLVQAAALPVTLGGAARHNVANALAALAALLGGGFNTGAALSALQGFDNNAQNNPLRLNMHTIDGVLVLVDYAHNVAAYRAIAATARNIAHGRVVGVVTAPGDRRDEDLADTGEVCAQLFDELIIYEMDDLRDRPQGQVYAAISRGIPADVTHRCIADVREALAAAVLGCVDGDIVVLGCASELSDVKAAMQLVASQKQRRVEPASGLIGLHPAAGPASP